MPPLASTEAQVVILYLFRIDIVCSIMGMTENSNTIRRESRAQFLIVLEELNNETFSKISIKASNL